MIKVKLNAQMKACFYHEVIVKLQFTNHYRSLSDFDRRTEISTVATARQ